MIDEYYEMLGRCVVCCADITPDEYGPDYCSEHKLASDPSFPPVPIYEWWPDLWEDPDDRFVTGSRP